MSKNTSNFGSFNSSLIKNKTDIKTVFSYENFLKMNLELEEYKEKVDRLEHEKT